MTLKRKIIALLVAMVLLAGGGIAFLSSTWKPEQEGFLRARLPNADDLKETVKNDKYEQLEGKTNFIKDYILDFLDNLME
ncbi:MAG: hypothetical protein DBY25_06885 [Clostridiales bacterium]|nr:MAG: hypothetical protein DBY25_06885 [Clostridiales bacterium]